MKDLSLIEKMEYDRQYNTYKMMKLFIKMNSDNEQTVSF